MPHPAQRALTEYPYVSFVAGSARPSQELRPHEFRSEPLPRQIDGESDHGYHADGGLLVLLKSTEAGFVIHFRGQNDVHFRFNADGTFQSFRLRLPNLFEFVKDDAVRDFVRRHYLPPLHVLHDFGGTVEHVVQPPQGAPTRPLCVREVNLPSTHHTRTGDLHCSLAGTQKSENGQARGPRSEDTNSAKKYRRVTLR